ncbi:MAG: YolD-like family protein [Sporolactobacillus sp.]|uniref:YolD-like family protein n=1 Tax=Sporolactobacillus sp. STSJ-5 TaxID=2965076 RepID=UPI002102B168|nr:YolD-like family protein [Sporolactobacillus sp. STSJ-5]MCQ2008565.1 YolD-like family protein [Sporolactobacillus sp. STSJ-5]
MKNNKLTNGSNMRWESSRMMLPEHVQALRELAREESKRERPYLDEQRLEEIEQIVREAALTKKSVNIDSFHNGVIQKIPQCHLSIDENKRCLHISDQWGMLHNISPRDIIDIRFN